MKTRNKRNHQRSDGLVPPPEASAATPVTGVTKQENIMEEEDNGGLTD